MALWRDLLDELIADLERTLPNLGESTSRDDQKGLLGLSFIEMQMVVHEMMKGPRIPLEPEPCGDGEAAEHPSSSKPTP